MLLVKVFACVFLLVVVFFSGADYVCFRIAQQQIRREVKALIRKGLNEDDLTKITVTADNINDIEWVKEGRELVYHGEMYDVVKAEKTRSGIVLSCFNDKKEGRLLARCMNNTNASRIFHKFRKSFVFVHPLVADEIQLVLPQSFSAVMNSEFHSPELAVLSPPPRFI